MAGACGGMRVHPPDAGGARPRPRPQIPEHGLAAHVARYPHLKTLADNARLGKLQASGRSRENATRRAAPQGVSPREVWELAGVANGGSA